MPDFSIRDLWWLQTDNPRVGQEALQGIQIGMQNALGRSKLAEEMRSNTAGEAIRRFQAETERSNVQSMIDLRLAEKQSLTARSRGLAEISSLLAQTAAKGGWDNPANEEAFWTIAAKYPQSIEKNDLDALYNNTFGEAKRRKAMISRGRNGTVTEQDFTSWQLLRDNVDNAIDDDDKIRAKTELSMFEKMKGINPTGSGAPVEGRDFGTSADDAGNKTMWWRTGKTGDLRFRAVPNTADQFALARFRSRLSAIQNMVENYDPKIITNGQPDPNKQNNLINEAWTEAFSNRQAPSKQESGNIVPDSIPSYDPMTRKLVLPNKK